MKKPDQERVPLIKKLALINKTQRRCTSRTTFYIRHFNSQMMRGSEGDGAFRPEVASHTPLLFVLETVAPQIGFAPADLMIEFEQSAIDPSRTLSDLGLAIGTDAPLADAVAASRLPSAPIFRNS
jgi:hypothetical protein